MAEGLIVPLAKEDVAVIGHDRRASFALPGLLLATGALVCAIISLLVLLGLNRNTLRKKIRELGVSVYRSSRSA